MTRRSSVLPSATIVPLAGMVLSAAFVVVGFWVLMLMAGQEGQIHG
ncbi:hypothetical protein [Saccharopolyspora hattusasensis]